MKPQLAALAKKHGDKVVVLLVDANKNSPLAMKAKVRSIPDTRLLLGGKELSKVVGGYPMEHFEDLVLKHANALPPPPRTAKASGGTSSTDGKTIVPMKDDWLPPGVTKVK